MLIGWTVLLTGRSWDVTSLCHLDFFSSSLADLVTSYWSSAAMRKPLGLVPLNKHALHYLGRNKRILFWTILLADGFRASPEECRPLLRKDPCMPFEIWMQYLPHWTSLSIRGCLTTWSMDDYHFVIVYFSSHLQPFLWMRFLSGSAYPCLASICCVCKVKCLVKWMIRKS